MAGSWVVDIEVTDLAQRKIRATGTRTDGLDIRTFTLEGIVDPADKPGSVVKIADGLWSAYQAKVTEEAGKSALIATGEAAVASNLDAREAP
jgi:hypothetical protein